MIFFKSFLLQADVDKAVAAARDAFQLDSKWRKMDASQKGKLIYKLAELIERDIDYLAVRDTVVVKLSLFDFVVDYCNRLREVY